MSNAKLELVHSTSPESLSSRHRVTYGSSSPYGNGGGGGDDMLVRVAKLESNVEDIKANLAEARADIRELRKTSADTSRDVAVILQKQIDIDEKLSKKPSVSEMNSAITSAVNRQIVWTILTAIGIAGLSLTAARLLF